MNLTSFIFSGVPHIIQLYADLYYQQDLKSTLQELDGDFGFPRTKNYDFIVVGGGTAGSVVAGRLSEDGKYTVLLLEEGANPVPPARKGHPGGVRDHPAINREFTTLPQANFAQDTAGVTKTYAGKMLGGSGSHNANVYNRGSPKDYDNWANLTGDSSWEYENIVKYYKKAEDFVGFLFNENERELYYGKGGPLTVDVVKPPYFDKWIAAGAELGYSAADTNGRQTEAFTTMPKTAYRGERESTYRKYIEGAESSSTNKSSLTVIRYARVDEILINEANQAYGVRYYRHGIPQIAHAKREIIISASAYISPLLLIRSGIGPKEVLTKAGIKVKVDLPGVGKNLWDHAAVHLKFICNSNATENDPEVSENSEVEIALNLIQGERREGGGPLLEFNGTQAFISSTTAKSEGKGDWPDIQFIFRDPGIYNPGIKYFLMVGNMRPKSFGEMVYNTTAHIEGETDFTKLGNPDFRYFTDVNGTDMKVMIEGIRIGLKVLTETYAFEGENLSIDPKQVPPICKELDASFHSDEFWKCFIRRKSVTVDHLGGTCKMGANSDPMAVVDSKLRVKGVKGLRVVDASIMPVVTNSNTNAPTIVIAEKAAADILSDIHQI